MRETPTCYYIALKENKKLFQLMLNNTVVGFDILGPVNEKLQKKPIKSNNNYLIF